MLSLTHTVFMQGEEARDARDQGETAYR
jgi:hypothetical protein